MIRIGKVFISYSSKDTEFVDTLVADLRARGIPVWYDKLDVAIGDSVPGRINEGLANCKHFLIAMSPSSMDSKWVQEELNASLIRQVETCGTFILPVMIEDCKVPPLLAHRRYADFRKSYEDGLLDLLTTWETDIEACKTVGKEVASPLPDDRQSGEDFFYLHSERFDRFFRVMCDFSFTCNKILSHVIENRSLAYRQVLSDSGLVWHFTYRLLFNDKAIPLSKTLGEAGVTRGSVLRLGIASKYEDVYTKELKSMWDGLKIYEASGAIRREQYLKKAILARGPLTKESLNEFANQCFRHV